MRDTPETDCAVNKSDTFNAFEDELIDLARKLEREWDSLKKAYDCALRQMNEAIASREWYRTTAIVDLERERDEARKDLEFRRDLFAFQAKQLEECRDELTQVRGAWRVACEELAAENAKYVAERALADRLASDLAACRSTFGLPPLDSLTAWKEARK